MPSRLGKPGLMQNLLCCWAWMTVLQKPCQGEMQTSKTKVIAPASESGGSRPGIPDTGEGLHDASSAQNSPSVKRTTTFLSSHSRLGTLRTQPWAAAFYSLKHFLSCSFLLHTGASLVAQIVKNLPAVQETWVQSLGREDPLEKGMATHSSILAWRLPQTEQPGWRATVHEVTKSWTRLSD